MERKSGLILEPFESKQIPEINKSNSELIELLNSIFTDKRNKIGTGGSSEVYRGQFDQADAAFKFIKVYTEQTDKTDKRQIEIFNEKKKKYFQEFELQLKAGKEANGKYFIKPITAAFVKWIDPTDTTAEHNSVYLVIIMPLLHQSLEKYKLNSRPSSNDIQSILSQLYEALLFLSVKLKIRHQDINPSNIFVEVDPTGKPQIIITDFGLAENQEQHAKRGGTPIFAAPEVFGGNIVNNVDVYSYARVCLFLILDSFSDFFNLCFLPIEDEHLSLKIKKSLQKFDSIEKIKEMTNIDQSERSSFQNLSELKSIKITTADLIRAGIPQDWLEYSKVKSKLEQDSEILKKITIDTSTYTLEATNRDLTMTHSFGVMNSQISMNIHDQFQGQSAVGYYSLASMIRQTWKRTLKELKNIGSLDENSFNNEISLMDSQEVNQRSNM